MKIGIFGGSFNPPHKMHENIAKYIIEQNILDKIIFVPTGNAYKYKNNLVKDSHRFNMIKIIVDKYDCLSVSDYELKDYTVYTCDTLSYFQERYKDDIIYFICGLDNLSYIDKWKNAEYLLNNFKFLVVKRSTDNLSDVLKTLELYKDHIEIVDMDEVDISSTDIRALIKKDIKSEYLDEDVYKYIQDNNLYKEEL